MTELCVAGDGRRAEMEIVFYTAGRPLGEAVFGSYYVCRVHDAVFRGMLEALERSAEKLLSETVEKR